MFHRVKNLHLERRCSGRTSRGESGVQWYGAASIVSTLCNSAGLCKSTQKPHAHCLTHGGLLRALQGCSGQ